MQALTGNSPSLGQSRQQLMLLVNAGDDCYAIDIREVAEIVASASLARIPSAPEGVAGLLDYHGRMVPVVDLCRITLGRDCQRLLSTRIVMLTGLAGSPHAALIGLRAEHATDNIPVEPAELAEVQAGSQRAVYLRRSVSGRSERIPVLCLDRLMPEQVRLWLAPNHPEQK